MWDFSIRASPSFRNPTSFYRKSLLNSELLQLAIAICEFYISLFFNRKSKDLQIIYLVGIFYAVNHVEKDQLRFYWDGILKSSCHVAGVVEHSFTPLLTEPAMSLRQKYFSDRKHQLQSRY